MYSFPEEKSPKRKQLVLKAELKLKLGLNDDDYINEMSDFEFN